MPRVLSHVKHLPVACRKTGKSHYSFRNHSAQFVCPTCRRAGYQNLNFLGQGKVICDGIKFKIDRSYKGRP